MKTLSRLLSFIKHIPILGKLLKELLFTIWKIPFVKKLVNNFATNFLASSTTPRPRPYSLWSSDPNPQGEITDYTSWPALTNKKFSGRHHPPAPKSYISTLPKDTPYNREEKILQIMTLIYAKFMDFQKKVEECFAH